MISDLIKEKILGIISEVLPYDFKNPAVKDPVEGALFNAGIALQNPTRFAEALEVIQQRLSELTKAVESEKASEDAVKQRLKDAGHKLDYLKTKQKLRRPYNPSDGKLVDSALNIMPTHAELLEAGTRHTEAEVAKQIVEAIAGFITLYAVTKRAEQIAENLEKK